MNAVRISLFFTFFLFLFTVIPSSSAAVLPHGQMFALSLQTAIEDNANRQLPNLESTGNSTPIGNASAPIYSINAFVDNPQITGGQPLEIYIYLSGFGIPPYNKLYINWTAPSVIDETSPGNWMVFGGTPRPFDETFARSVYLLLKPEDFFNPYGNSTTQGAEDFGIPLVVSEHDEKGKPPILINLRTLNRAKSGDYQINFTFTYGNETDLRQDFTTVQFHVKSSWEQWQQQWVAIIGAVLALIAFLFSYARRMLTRLITFAVFLVSSPQRIFNVSTAFKTFLVSSARQIFRSRRRQ
jgi:hypothetical protein